jgi:ABC-type sulfate transport system permease subunit
MGKTIAQALKEEAAIERSRDFLLLLLREQFTTVPDDVVTEVMTATEIHQFDVWGSAFVTARTLADIPFKASPLSRILNACQ